MSKYTARQTLKGTFGRVWLDGVEVGILSSVSATVTNNYEDVQVGSDVDRTLVSQTGEGTLTVKQVNNIATSIFERYKGGKDPRFVIEANLKDPSALNEQQEGYTLNNVSFDSIPLISWEVGSVIQKELPFKFTPSDVQVNDQIFDED